MRITETQFEWLKRLRCGEMLAAEIPTVTRKSLRKKKLVEECPRMYFGPRSYRLRLSSEGLGTLLWLEDIYGGTDD